MTAVRRVVVRLLVVAFACVPSTCVAKALPDVDAAPPAAPVPPPAPQDPPDGKPPTPPPKSPDPPKEDPAAPPKPPSEPGSPPGGAREGDVVVQGIGSAPIEGSDEKPARAAAFTLARCNALQVAGAGLPARGSVFRNRFVTTQIVERFPEVFSKVTVVREGPREESPRTYEVRIEAAIAPERIEEAARKAVHELLRAHGRPRLAILIESTRADFPPAAVATLRNKLIGSLGATGFGVIDVGADEGLKDFAYDLAKFRTGDVDTLKGLAAKSNFDYALTCTLSGTAERNEDIGRFVAEARVSFNAYETRTGSALAGDQVASERKATGQDAEAALAEATVQLTGRLHGAIVEGLLFGLAAKYEGFPVWIEILNCDFDRALEILDLLRSVPGFEAASPDSNLNTSTIRGDFSHPPERLYERIRKHKFQGFAVVTERKQGGYFLFRCEDR